MTDSYTVSTLKFSVIINIIEHFFRLIVSLISKESMWTLAVVTITTLFSTNCRAYVYVFVVISFLRTAYAVDDNCCDCPRTIEK